MKMFFILTSVLQILLMIADEFIFHWRRNLPKWERLGHPVDTLSFLFPFLILGFAPQTQSWKIAYIALSVLSCLIITKDEWVHSEVSPASEQWLHANLFVLHPVVLISAFFLWQDQSLQLLFQAMSMGIFIFMLYQFLFWNFYADRIFKK